MDSLQGIKKGIEYSNENKIEGSIIAPRFLTSVIRHIDYRTRTAESCVNKKKIDRNDRERNKYSENREGS